MNRKYAFIFAAVFSTAISTSALAAYNGEDPNQSAGAAASAAPTSDETSIVRGKAVSIDPNDKSITVTDVVSGNDRTFIVTRKEEIQDIKPGDKVDVTPKKDNVSQAEKVQKE